MSNLKTALWNCCSNKATAESLFQTRAERNEFLQKLTRKVSDVYVDGVTPVSGSYEVRYARSQCFAVLNCDTREMETHQTTPVFYAEGRLTIGGYRVTLKGNWYTRPNYQWKHTTTMIDDRPEDD